MAMTLKAFPGLARGAQPHPAPDAELNRAELDAQAAALAERIRLDNERVQWEQRCADAKLYPTLFLADAAEARAAIIARRDKAKAEWDAAQKELRLLEVSRDIACRKLTPIRDAVRARLVQTAPPILDEVAAELQKSVPPIKSRSEGMTSDSHKKFSNVRAVQEYAAAVLAAVSKLGELKLKALTDEQLAREIKAIRKALPKVSFEPVEVSSPISQRNSR